jgi:lysozyme family protein
MTYTFDQLKDEYTKRWGSFLITKDPDLITKVAERLARSADRYKTVQNATGVPWEWIAVVHEREASQAWSLSLAQGDPWNHVSTHVPAGLGPYNSWEEAAIDALELPQHALDKVTDWSPEMMLYSAEKWNGWGPRYKGYVTGYLWSYTDQYIGGKFVADHVWDKSVYDKQIGVAPILKKLLEAG